MSVKRSLFITAAIVLLCLRATAFAEGFAGLGGDASGFIPVTPGRPLAFPRDFGAHPGFRTEWWYLTANLHDAAGAAYGVQWTLFRQATTPGEERKGWASQNVWMGHAAVTSADAHLFSETLARGGVGQAGVSSEPFRAWIDDWFFAAQGDQQGGGLSRMKVFATGQDFRYALDLRTSQPLVLHGEAGFSRKSAGGQASYYFSQPFFLVEGFVVIAGRETKVSGRAWMDREWSSQPLASNQKGWDWFSLHLSSGEKLMLFRLRSETAQGFYAGTWIGADGVAQALDSNDIALTPLAATAVDGHNIPVRWNVQVKSRRLDIETAPLNAKSWMATRFSYWEGPISFGGSHQGEGYLEMTGY